jgi:hypothetical protein
VVSVRPPVYLGPPIRQNLSSAASRNAIRPLAAAAALQAGISPRDLMSFAVWHETARALSIRRIRHNDGSISDLTRCLPTITDSLPTRAPAVGLAMMVQNEERRLAACLESAKDWVSEIVVVDGGSTDGTREIAAQYGARVIERSFDGDYSAQRNVGLRAIRTPWTLVLDADERLSKELPAILDHIASSGHADGAHLHFLNSMAGETKPWFWPDRKLRFFRSGHLMVGRIHERIQGIRRSVYLPISGPFILHGKTLSEQWDREKQYYELDPSYYSKEDARRIAEWSSRADDGSAP